MAEFEWNGCFDGRDIYVRVFTLDPPHIMVFLDESMCKFLTFEFYESIVDRLRCELNNREDKDKKLAEVFVA